jgi:tRNA A37 threonylcarbamoyladenosine modification protein TsaB
LKALRKPFRFRASVKTLTEANNRLAVEYFELCSMGGKQHLAGKEIVLMNIQIRRLSVYIDIYESGNVEIMEKIVGMTGYETIAEAKHLLEQWIYDMEAEHKRLEKEAKDKKDVSYDMNSMVVDVCRWLGFQLDRKGTTVSEFAGYMASFSKCVEQMDKKSSKL